ncbi:hypothetical protein ACFSSC_03195 [Corynebacterium mendelii]|uniref:Uncharacterized protein n=1 Tax=Corynebacterium mendelii TaxID=2765362 RepID=A0A939DZB5_9CORY|nr:hypothetical protein [Corynebacterium mendelii]
MVDNPRPGQPPVPRDPSTPVMTPEEIDRAMALILDFDNPDPVAEADQLARAHEILGRALG